MDFTFTGEQDELRRAVRDALSHPDPWPVLRDQIGVTGLAVAEQYGGHGATWVELGIALEEAGRTLLPDPLLATTCAAAALERAGAVEHLPALAGGELVATIAVADATTGSAAPVIHGDAAQLFVRAGAEGLHLLRAESAEIVAATTVDQTRSQAVLRFAPGDATQVGDAAAAATAVDLLRVALAVESVGAARRCLELTVEHLKTRVQFGKPIGSFQALKHRAADMAVAVEAATSAAYHAMWVAAAAPHELPVVAPLAMSYCTSAFQRVAGDTIQLHGGIGFTWEHDAHRYFKRAAGNAAVLGSPAAQRRVLAERAGF